MDDWTHTQRRNAVSEPAPNHESPLTLDDTTGPFMDDLHPSPPVGVLVVAYLIGQLGGNPPIPGGIIGLDGGLIGAFVLYNQPLATTTGAVLLYHAIALWVPGLLGTSRSSSCDGSCNENRRPPRCARRWRSQSS